MNIKSRIGLFVAFALVLVALASADLSCTVGTSCSDTTILRLENDSGGYQNAHAQLPGYGSYDNYLCCSSSTQTVGISCTAPKSSYVLRLSNETNAHVQDAYNDSISIIYNNVSCISGTGTNFCTLSETSCPSGYECLASIAGTEGNNYTNAHIADCSYYSLKVCCFLNSLPDISNPSLVSTSGQNLTSDNLTVSFTATDADSHAIFNVTDWRISGTSIAVLNMPFNTNVSNYSEAFVKDYSTYQNNGTLGNGVSSSAPAWNSSGKLGGAYYFDGTSDYINIPSPGSELQPQNITISVWVNIPGSTSGDRAIVGTSQYLLQANSDSVRWWPDIAVGSQSISKSISGWTHIAITHNYGNNETEFFVDGDIESTLTIPGSARSWTYMYIGAYSGPSRYFSGAMDELIIFNRKLSPEQIKEIYNSQTISRSVNRILSKETNKGQTWSVAVTPSDGYDDGTTKTSNSLTIQNSVPDVPILIYPVDETIINRFPDFNWTTSTDEDGDPIHYEINVTAPTGINCFGFSDDNVLDSNMTSPLELCTDLDYASGSYEWNVRACDPTQCSAWSDTGHFNVTSVNSISLEQATVDFSLIERDTSDDTTDNNPFPLVVRNDGNIRVNISVTAQNPLFQTVPDLNDSSFQFMAGINESGAFNTSKSIMSWINVTNFTQNLVSTLLYFNESDAAEIELRIHVPLFEPAGSKQTSLVIESSPDSPS